MELIAFFFFIYFLPLKKTTHQELYPYSFMSVMANMTPFSEFNQSPRNMYQCQVEHLFYPNDYNNNNNFIIYLTQMNFTYLDG